MFIVNVVLSLPIISTFDYIIPDNIYPIVGGRVLVPFGSRKVIGIIIKSSKYSSIDSDKLKTVTKVLDQKSLFPKSLWRTLIWAIGYYHYPAGKVLFHALPVLIRQGKSTEITSLQYWCSTEKGRNLLPSIIKNSPKQKIALSALLLSPICRNQLSGLNIKETVLQSLRDKGLCNLCTNSVDNNDWRSKFYINKKRVKLNSEQINAIKRIYEKDGYFTVWLMSGVTGSGKTEVYMTVLENILSKGRQALVLVPEISLTSQTTASFRDRFNAPIEILHSRLNNMDRLSVWVKARRGECAIVIGTRSALFTPFARLGAIVIDEEHDDSYKQHKGWKYHARDMAVILAREENIPIILGTATPAIESLYNVQQKKYQQLTLKNRAGSSCFASHHLQDLRGQPMVNGFSVQLLKQIREHLNAGNQVMLFLNRRGFSSAILCHSCSWIAECKRCDHHYTFHKHIGQMICHHCDSKKLLPNSCPKCNGTQLIPIGIGTEKLEKTMRTLFPNTPITRIDRDTTSYKGSLEDQLAKIHKNDSRILIGTQMLAKGHHFPKITLVAMLNVDSALFSKDFRAAENFAQLYTQVSGRAGRSDKKSNIFIQTHYPNHPLLYSLLKYGYMNFAKKILEERRLAYLPPFYRHILFRAYDYDNHQASQFLDQLRQLLDTNSQNDNQLCLMGPIPALFPKRAGRFRWQLLLSHPSRIYLKNLVDKSISLISTIPQRHKVRWTLDVDPIDN